jgi:hypothetical protein
MRISSISHEDCIDQTGNDTGWTTTTGGSVVVEEIIMPGAKRSRIFSLPLDFGFGGKPTLHGISALHL